MRARDDDNIRPRRRPISTEHLSNQSFSKISFHSAADFSRRRNPETSHRQLGGKKKNRHVSRLNPHSPLVNTLKVSTSPDVFVAAERMPHGIVRAGSLLVGDSQTLPPFGSTTVEHLSTVLGAHSNEKSVGFAASTAVRLKRSLHGRAFWSSPSNYELSILATRVRRCQSATRDTCGIGLSPLAKL